MGRHKFRVLDEVVWNYHGTPIRALVVECFIRRLTGEPGYVVSWGLDGQMRSHATQESLKLDWDRASDERLDEEYGRFFRWCRRLVRPRPLTR